MTCLSTSKTNARPPIQYIIEQQKPEWKPVLVWADVSRVNRSCVDQDLLCFNYPKFKAKHQHLEKTMDIRMSCMLSLLLYCVLFTLPAFLLLSNLIRLLFWNTYCNAFPAVVIETHHIMSCFMCDISNYNSKHSQLF